MPLESHLSYSFYNRPVVQVAREMLGMRLVRLWNGQRLAGIITETEAYRGEEDLACHARSGRTARTAVMYGPPGRAYVYFTYGMHWMLNCVCEEEGFPAAVLIRAVQPVEGLASIAAHRPGRPPAEWCSGPARLTQALRIDAAQNGADLCAPASELWLEAAAPVSDNAVSRGPRVGISRTPEPWRSIPWRFSILGAQNK